MICERFSRQQSHGLSPRAKNINVGENGMCFIPMNVHNELFYGVRQLRWQHLSPVGLSIVSTLSTSIGLYQAFIILFHKAMVVYNIIYGSLYCMCLL